MCGIMGYIGKRPAKDVIYAGLKRMEYRGYDSVGITVLDKTLHTVRAVGDTSKLTVGELPADALVGIGHTRWATHGEPSVRNAHPHTFGSITLVHNGIIENYEDLKELINPKKLQSQTDTEVLAAVIDKFFTQLGDLLEAIKAALALVKGTFGIAVLAENNTEHIIAARRGSPILIGVGNGQNFIASDPSAIIDHTDKVIYLEDNQIAVVTSKSVDVYDLKLNRTLHELTRLDKAQHKTDKGKYKSFLEKEIFEQPNSLRQLMRGRVSSDGNILLGGPELSHEEIESLQQIIIVACGTAYYAALYAKYILEELLDIPVTVEQASEFRYRYGSYNINNSLAIFVSQSGETADLLASLTEAKRRNIKTMGIINVVGSAIARTVDHGGIYLHAGAEMSVASTKAYSSMVSALLMFGGFLGLKRGLNPVAIRQLAKELLSLPDEIENTLLLKQQIDKLAADLLEYENIFYLGRNVLYPVALEGALKITEVAYVHAQGLPLGEMKHGPIALINEHFLCVVLLPEDDLLYEKSLSSLAEIKARHGKVLSISTRPKPSNCDHHIQVAHLGDHVDGLIVNVCLQLLALATATLKGVNIDKPRNLAKSVTVE